jgi:hypothetical protein
MKGTHAIFVLLILISGATLNLNAQCKTYDIGVKGDTLNCTDVKGKKQGKWIERVEEVRGEPGFESEGEYYNNRKEGVWKSFNLQGDKIAEEFYKWGGKDGICKYFDALTGLLVREENWMAIDPSVVGDTIIIDDPNDPKGMRKIKRYIKEEGYSLKHGTWTYYSLETGRIQRLETYDRDSLLNKPAVAATDKKDDKKGKAKPKVVENFEKAKKGKKIKYVDGSTGG